MLTKIDELVLMPVAAIFDAAAPPSPNERTIRLSAPLDIGCIIQQTPSVIGKLQLTGKCVPVGKEPEA